MSGCQTGDNRSKRERDAMEADRESERWISMSETPSITSLLLSVQ